MSTILVIADLHLEADRPDITQCFYDFLIATAQHKDQYQALYILGDLFEVWVGDDNKTQFNQDVASAIKSFSTHIPVYFIHGNRDFLLGKKYAQSAGMTLLPELHQISQFDKNIVFMHGDQLCLDDVDYQKFRKKSRSWWWKAMMLSLPLSFRQKKARNIRSQSQQNKMTKSQEIMDVAEREVTRVITNTKCDYLIHGHTHRPNIHQYQQSKRVVVGDWYTQGSVLEVSKEGVKLKQLTFSD